MPSCSRLLLFFVLFCSACRVCPPCFVRHPIQVGATKVNSGSSRSHLVCMVGGAYVCLNRLGTSVNILVISFPLVETDTSPSASLSLFSAGMVGPLLLCTCGCVIQTVHEGERKNTQGRSWVVSAPASHPRAYPLPPSRVWPHVMEGLDDDTF